MSMLYCKSQYKQHVGGSGGVTILYIYMRMGARLQHHNVPM